MLDSPFDDMTLQELSEIAFDAFTCPDLLDAEEMKDLKLSLEMRVSIVKQLEACILRRGESSS